MIYFLKVCAFLYKWIFSGPDILFSEGNDVWLFVMERQPE